MRRTLAALVVTILAATAMPVMLASPGKAEYIRMDRLCDTMRDRLKEQISNPLYAKALQRKKEGSLLPVSRERLEYGEQMRSVMRSQHCANIP